MLFAHAEVFWLEQGDCLDYQDRYADRGRQSADGAHECAGMTLYYRTSDTPSSFCSGGCASAWPPVLSTTMPSVSTTLPGTFSLMNNANGSQVAYNGHPLYTYSSDSAPGQANGPGFGNIWFVAPTTLSATTTPSGSTTPTPGGYHYP
jgi:predicted lipoprotein with Yx(FWY)xxD motif